MARFTPQAGFASAFECLIDHLRRSYAEVVNEVEVFVDVVEMHDLVDSVECLTLVELSFTK